MVPGRGGRTVERASGVGPKLAQRILVELKGKPIGSAGFSAAGVAAAPAPGPAPVSAAGEAVAALMGLGVAEVQARRLVDQAAAALGPAAGASDLVPAGPHAVPYTPPTLPTNTQVYLPRLRAPLPQPTIPPTLRTPPGAL